jgi:UDP-glucose 4-epimerase
MKLLVAGGAGYIGSVVSADLVNAGHEVVILDDLSTGHADAVPDGARLVVGDIRTDALVVLAHGGFDGVLHFAGKSLVGESVVTPELYWDINVGGSLALVRTAVAAGVPRFVFSSSAAVYGDAGQGPIREDAPLNPSSPYGATKLAVDLMLADMCHAHGIGTVSLRYFNVGGAVDRFGERHATETHLVPIILQAAAGTRECIEIYGDDWPTPDATCIRDYIHVADLSAAHVLALGHCQPSEHLVVNLGTGTGFSVREVLATAERVVGHKIPSRVAPRRAGDPAVLVAAADRAHSVLGWTPIRGLEQIISDAWQFALRSETEVG